MKILNADLQSWQDLPGYKRNILLTSADLNSPGTRVQIVTIAPGETISKHYHVTSYEVYCVLNGRCVLTVGDQEIILHPGTLLTIEPGDVHRLHNDGRELFELLVFKTNAEPNDTFWQT